ncbi:MAG TPA: PASTA domain-containing protein [Pyrinomonadaceae bacterium]|jgi:serine/threonine-protein kinase
MPSVFAITTASDKLKSETGSTTTVFTITNSTSRPLRGIVKVRPLGSTQAQWLKIEGETERDFPAGGTHQFTVDFNRPKPVAAPTATPQPAESFPFRLDAISAINPDEDFTEGPVVTVEIPEQTVEPKKPFPWWIVAVAAVLLIVAGVVAWLLLRGNGGGGGKVEVPDVTNQTFAEANTKLQNATLKAVKVEPTASNKEPDKVFEQDPEAGTKVAANSNVNVSVPAATGVPRVIGLKIEDARALLTQRGLTMGDPIQSKDVPDSTVAGTIGFQFPTPNSTALKGTEVKVFVPCRGIKCFLITDVVSDKLNAVDKKLIDSMRTK